MNGQRPLNVPRMNLRAMAQYRFAGVPGLRSSLRLNHEGTRRVTEDAVIQLPAWTTLDLATHYVTRIQGTRTGRWPSTTWQTAITGVNRPNNTATTTCTPAHRARCVWRSRPASERCTRRFSKNLLPLLKTG